MTYFAEPVVEVIKFAVEDVVTASSVDDDFPTMDPPCL